MLASTILRFVSGVLLFVIMARFWGPETFGYFMYPYTLVTIIVILIDYGFNLQIVRDIGKNAQHAHKLTCEAVVAKSLLVIAVTLVGLPLLFLVDVLDGYRILLLLLILSNVLSSYSLLFNLTFRGMGLFNKETIVAFWSSLATFILVGGLVFLGKGPIAAAFGFLLSKIFSLGLSWAIYQRLIGGVKFIYPSRNAVFKMLRTGFPFAAHVALGTLYFSVDTLVIQYFMGPEKVGIYQAGFRIMVGGLILTDVLSNVYLSKMAADSSDRNALVNLATSMTRHCLMIGVLGFVFLSGFSDLLVKFFYGNSGFAEVIQLFPLFGVVLLLRYWGASYGILLTVDDRQIVRMIGVGLSVIVSISLNIILIPRFNLIGALTASIITHVFLNSIYIFFACRQVRSWLIETRSGILIFIAMLMGFIQLAIVPHYGIMPYSLIFVTILFVGLVGITPAEYSKLVKRLQINMSNAI